MVIVPTRELAIQVGKQFERFKNNSSEYRVLSVYGGTPIYQQINKLRNGIDVLVGTPGRTMDLQNRGILNCKALKFLILDETDQMLKQGF